MARSSTPIPPGYPRLAPYLIIEGAAAAIDFYTRVFGARERMRLPMGDKLGHAELQIGDSVLMLADPVPAIGAHPPGHYRGSPVTLNLYVEDVDAVVAAAVAAGAKLERAVSDQFYGDRAGSIRDPFGHLWHLATHVEDVSAEEMQRRLEAMSGQG